MCTSCSQRVLINFVTLWDVSLDGGGMKVYYKRLLPPKTGYRFRKQSLSRYCLFFFFFVEKQDIVILIFLIYKRN